MKNKNMGTGLMLAVGWLLALGVHSAAGQEEPAHPRKALLWKVEGPKLGAVSYLFGTIHLGVAPVDRLHPAAQKAFDGADALYTEVSMNPEDQLKVATMIIRTDKKTLEQSIGEKLSAELDAELKAINPALDAAPLQTLKTWGIGVTLPMLPLQLQGGKALDQILWDKAVAAGKPTSGLELAKDQVAIFDELTEAEQVIFLAETMRQLRADRAAGRDSTGELVAAYAAGDPAKVQALIERSLRELSESEHKELGARLIKRLLADRDQSMAATIDGHLRANPDKCHFFAAGAGHFVGPASTSKNSATP
jgi:uncharacterized protein YbaP (TraB family)